MLLRFQRKKVHDIVAVFCYLCRTRSCDSYAPNWPFLFGNWEHHVALGVEGSSYGQRDKKQLSYFIQYWSKHFTGRFGHGISLLKAVELYTATWTEEQFELANSLFVKYYGVTCDG